MRWHLNRGWDAPTETVPVSDIPGSFRPDMIPLVLQELETPRALGLASLAEHSREVEHRTNEAQKPGMEVRFDSTVFANAP